MMKLPTRHATSRLRVAGSRASRRGHECDFTNRARAARGPTYLSGKLLPVCSLKRAIKFSVASAGVCTSVCAALAMVPTY
jgi:hypothetical protein